MSTNYYCKTIPSQEMHNKMQEALNNHQYDTLKAMLDEIIKEIHIGKYTTGWQFIFNLYDSPWSASLDSIKYYLSQNNISIYDEYGTCYTFDEFWNKISDSLYNDDAHDNAESFLKAHSNEEPYIKSEYIDKDGIRWFQCEFS